MKSLEDDINAFLELWDCQRQCEFLRDIIPLFDLYDIDEENDWVSDLVGEDDERNIRLIRTVYLVSRIAEFHAGRLCRINTEFKDLWKRIEKEAITNDT